MMCWHSAGRDAGGENKKTSGPVCLHSLNPHPLISILELFLFYICSTLFVVAFLSVISILSAQRRMLSN